MDDVSAVVVVGEESESFVELLLQWHIIYGLQNYDIISSQAVEKAEKRTSNKQQIPRN